MSTVHTSPLSNAMSEQSAADTTSAVEPITRPVGGTEYSWCRAVPTGTGITVLTLLLSKPPNLPLLQTALHNLQNSHPILRSTLHFDPSSSSFSFLIPPQSHLQIQPYDLQSTASILSSNPKPSLDPHHLILEHEVNHNSWRYPPDGDTDVLFAAVYTISESRWVMVLRLHTGACDRAAAVAILTELLEIVGGCGGDEKEAGIGPAIEELIPSGKVNKPFWARGVDMLGYSLNSFRLSNLDFVNADSERISEVVRLRVEADETDRLLSDCKSKGIKLWAAIAAAGLIAARSSKELPDQQREKFAVVTLINCRSILDPALSNHNVGFYHSAILNTHDVSGSEDLWDLATRCYSSFTSAKNSNKHFTDMSDLNFLMCKAIENPGLTPSSSMRTAFISVFEDPVISQSKELHGEVGVEDYVGCASVHGVGPTIAVFDTIRDGRLDCSCVYPSPLHSRGQIQELVESMKRILTLDSNNVECNCN